MGKPDNWVKKGFQQDVKRVCNSACSALNPEYSSQLTPHHPHPFKAHGGRGGGNRSCRWERHCPAPCVHPAGGTPSPGTPEDAGAASSGVPGCGEPALPPVPPTAPGQTQHESPTAPAARAGVGGQRCLPLRRSGGHEMPHPAAHGLSLAPSTNTIPEYPTNLCWLPTKAPEDGMRAMGMTPPLPAPSPGLSLLPLPALGYPRSWLSPVTDPLLLSLGHPRSRLSPSGDAAAEPVSS